MPRSLQSHGQQSKIYVPVLLKIFRDKYVEGQTAIEFTQADIKLACNALGVAAANPADIIYRMKSRTVLPDEIQALGFRVLRPTGRGKYILEHAPSTLIDFPECEYIEVYDRTPPVVRRLLGISQLPSDLGQLDEQGLLSVIRYNDLISRFLSARVLHLKGHVRKSVAGVGQAEIDDVSLALPFDADEPITIVPVEAKAKDEPINRAQIAMQIRYARLAFPGCTVRPLTVKLFGDGVILFIEFDDEINAGALKPISYARYRLVLQST